MAEQHTLDCEHANFNLDHDDQTVDDPLAGVTRDDDVLEIHTEDDFVSAIGSPPQISSSRVKPNPKSSSVKDNTGLQDQQGPDNEKQIEVIIIYSSNDEPQIVFEAIGADSGLEKSIQQWIDQVPKDLMDEVTNNETAPTSQSPPPPPPSTSDPVVIRELEEDERQTMLKLIDARHKFTLDKATRVLDTVDDHHVRNIINSKISARRALDPTDLRHGLTNRRRQARSLRNRILSTIKMTAHFVNDGNDLTLCDAMKSDLGKLKSKVETELDERNHASWMGP